MAKQIDFDNLSDLDFDYVGQRPWLIEEANQAGYLIDVQNKTCVRATIKVIPASGAEVETPAVEVQELLEEEPEEIDAQIGVSEDEKDLGDEESEEAFDYSDLSVSELREELTERGLSFEGKKGDLISRLESHDEVE